MKVVLWLSFLFLIPVTASSQGRLFLQAAISIPVTGSSDFQAYVSHGSGAFEGTLEVKLRDTIALTVGDNGDSLRNTELDFGNKQFLCPGYCRLQFDSLNHILLKIGISGEGIGGKGFFLSVDSLQVVAVSDSQWTLASQNVPCSYSCYYADKYVMPNGNSGEDIASGIGQTTFTGRNVLSVRRSIVPSTIHITSFGGGVIQVEAEGNSVAQKIEIFDGLGRTVFHANSDGDAIRITGIRGGCYIARLGSEVMKFIVVQ